MALYVNELQVDLIHTGCELAGEWFVLNHVWDLKEMNEAELTLVGGRDGF